MSLSISQVAEVARELSQTDTKIADAQKTQQQTAQDQEALVKKNNTIKVFYQEANSLITAYFSERRWIDGTSYTSLPFNDINNGAKRAVGNIFYPPGWTNFAPFADDKVKGLPTVASSDSELGIFIRGIQDDGLSALIDFIVNGQSGGVNTTLALSGYTPGDTDIEVTSGGQTPGNVLLISGSGTSALVYIIDVVGTTITIEEIIPPAGTISSGGQVVENFSGFSNGERNSLTSGTYQNVLTELSVNIISAVMSWESAITSQLLQLVVNDPDRQPERTAAVNDATNAGDVINDWVALPNTGSTGSDSKFTDNNLLSLTNEISARTSFLNARVNQILDRLGNVTQNSEGDIRGSGLIRKRFETISLQINGTDGPLFQSFALDASKGAARQQINSTKQKANIFSSGVYLSKFKENATGSNEITIENPTNFDAPQRCVITGEGLEDLVVDIVSKSGNTLTLSKDVPSDYILDLGATISRAR